MKLKCRQRGGIYLLNVHEISITDNRRKEKGGEEENRKGLTGGSFYCAFKLKKERDGRKEMNDEKRCRD